MGEERQDYLGDEAARLIDGLQGLLRRGIAPTPGDVWGEVTDRIATGSAECRLCPGCRLLGVLRHARPEAFQHLVEAGDALTTAMQDVLDTHRRAWPPPRGAERPDIG